MYYKNLFMNLLAIVVLYGCGAHHSRFESLYPDRPRPDSERDILQTFVGKPASTLNRYLGSPDDQRLGIWVWGEEKWVYAPINQTHIGSTDMKRSNRDTCRVVAKTNEQDIIQSIYYEEDILESGSVRCPTIGNLNKLTYIVNPALYEYDKKHGIKRDNYWIPN